MAFSYDYLDKILHCYLSKLKYGYKYFGETRFQMKKGQRILVRAFPNIELERIIWEVGNTYVAVCRPEVYDDVKNLSGLPKQIMGFPKEDVVRVIN